MTAAPAGWTAAVVGAYRAGRPLALVFDYDGTLTPIAPHPRLAELPPAARERLVRLRALPAVAVGVVSGRALDDVRRMVGLDAVWYAGSGGLELDLAGRRLTYPGLAAFDRRLDALRPRLDPVLARHPGAWAERKPAALALHYRAVPAGLAGGFPRAVADALAGEDGVRVREVSRAVELTPAGGWDKGTAVRLILDRLPADVLPVYAGDAANDAEALESVAAAGGVAVGVGPDAPAAARVRVPTFAEFDRALTTLVADLWSVRRPAPDGPSGPEEAAPGVLVVDANRQARAAFAAGLRATGWRVWEAAEPDEAVRLLADHRDAIAAAVVDLQLPGLQGVWVLSELGRLSPRLVRCAMSADVSPYTAAAFRRLSPTPLFPKPFRGQAVAAALRALVRRSGEHC